MLMRIVIIKFNLFLLCSRDATGICHQATATGRWKSQLLARLCERDRIPCGAGLKIYTRIARLRAYCPLTKAINDWVKLLLGLAR